MAIEEYIKAYKMGKKEYQSRMLRGLKPTLEVLDDILPGKGTLSEVPLGLVQIPVDQIVGTKTYGSICVKFYADIERKYRICH